MEESLRNQIEAIKGSKISEKEKKRLIGLARKWAAHDRSLQRMPKEERLKAIYRETLDLTIDMALSLGRFLEAKRIKSSIGAVKFLKQSSKYSLTTELKKYKVLPLEG